ncbi:MAG: Omp28-related outer membrane protein [Bacteroidia bacterium]
MMKKIYTLIILMLAIGSLSAQTLASTTPENRNTVIEEFTGTSCPNCPPGHTIVKNIKTQYADDAWVVGYHPSNSGLTTPRSASDPDFRRSYLDAFYSTAFAGRRAMPLAMTNRKTWADGNRAQSRSAWASQVATTLAEASPINIGIEAEYDSATHILSGTVEVYFTANADEQTLYIMLMEDNLVAGQSGSSDPNYVHNHVFREAITPGQWGEALTVMPVAGNTYSRPFTFDNSAGLYDWENLSLITFVRSTVTEEIATGTGIDGVPLKQVNTGIDFQDISADIQVYPNPTEGISTTKLTLTEASPVTITLYNTVGKAVATHDFGTRSAGTQRLTFDSSNLPAGVYMMRVEAGDHVGNKRFVKQ